MLRFPWLSSSPPRKVNRLDPARWNAALIKQHYEEIIGKYQMRKPEAATVYLLRATQQDMDCSWTGSLDYGWRRVIPEIQVLDVNGGHASMLELGYFEALADCMNQLLRSDPRTKASVCYNFRIVAAMASVIPASVRIKISYRVFADHGST